jgi:hypothetical protein
MGHDFGIRCRSVALTHFHVLICTFLGALFGTFLIIFLVTTAALSF